MRTSVNYLLSGAAHAPYLIVSLHTLRQHYNGRITVWAYPESIDIVRDIALDNRLQVHAMPWNPDYTGKNSQFLNKILMMQNIEEDVGIYLDADIIVQGFLTPLFELGHRIGFCATQFNDWRAYNGKAAKRIEGLRGRLGKDHLIDSLLQTDAWPSVNGGVWACRPESDVLPQWYDWTWNVRDTFIADEVALHLFMADDRDDFIVAEGGHWNASPKFNKLPNDEVVIWHGHGDCFLRPAKSQKGFDLWWPKFEVCLDHNIGYIKDWLPRIDYRFLTECMAAKLHCPLVEMTPIGEIARIQGEHP